MYGYIYETTNLINGKKYIGQHRASEFDENYYGSGKILKQALLKEGKEHFKIKIIEECNSQLELNEKEIYYIKKFNAVSNNNYYNIGAGGSSWNNSFNNRPKEERSRIISEANYKRFQNPEERYKNGNAMRGKHHTKESRRKMSLKRSGKNHWLYGKHPSKKSIEKNRLAHLGKIASKETREKISQSLKGKTKGKILTDEHKNLISKSMKKYHRLHPEINYATLKNKIAVNDGNHRIYINKEELNMYLEKGFKLGYPKRKEVV